MPQLKASERRLLTLFGVVILGLFTYFFVFEYLVSDFKRVQLVNKGLARDLMEKRAMMARASETLPKRDWLDSNQPVAPDYILGAERLERFVVNTAEREGLQLADIGSVGEEIGSYYHSVFMDVEARGSIEAIVRWLSVLQDQEAFRAVTRCEIQPVNRKEPVLLKCEARIEQWYALPASALALSGPRPVRLQDEMGPDAETGASRGTEEAAAAPPGQEAEAEAGDESGADPGDPGVESEDGDDDDGASPRRVLLPGASRDIGRRPIAPPPVPPVEEAAEDEEESGAEVYEESGDVEELPPEEGEAGALEPGEVEGEVEGEEMEPSGEREEIPEADSEGGEAAAAGEAGDATFVSGRSLGTVWDPVCRLTMAEAAVKPEPLDQNRRAALPETQFRTRAALSFAKDREIKQV
ncbi:MAG TPA: hypothetical protein VMN36_12105 [Verrucomicrobiales bacterium]|nr:hypothetical protein [Verrucomicrobiales bacterium]